MKGNRIGALVGKTHNKVKPTETYDVFYDISKYEPMIMIHSYCRHSRKNLKTAQIAYNDHYLNFMHASLVKYIFFLNIHFHN